MTPPPRELSTVVGHTVGNLDGQSDLAHPGWMLAQCELGSHRQAVGWKIVAGKESPTVEGHAGSEAGHEHFGGRGGGVRTAVLCRLVDVQHVLANGDLEEIASLVINSNGFL